MARSWQDVAKLAQELRDGSLAAIEPPFPDLPTPLPHNVTGLPGRVLTGEEVAITESTPEDLVASLACGKLRSVDVTKAFLRRAGLAQKLTNCITELLPDRALERAKYLDDYLERENQPLGPLHGLPISVKEHVSMKGLGCNAGFVAWWDHIPEEDALILSFLWRAGCVFYARTTEPQSLMHLETSSNLYGETVNPFNRNLTCGGSSGGEGALIGLRGSCLGVGTDIGGSIRNPSACNGLYGLKPTTRRLPMAGCHATMLAAEAIYPAIGPMSTSLEGVKLFMKSIIDQEPWKLDQILVPLPWTMSEQPAPSPDRKIKVAVMFDDGIVRPHPPITRALTEVVNKLRGSSAFEVVEWEPYHHGRAWEIIASLYFADGGAEEMRAIEASGEPRRPLTDFILVNNPYVKALTVPELWERCAQRDKYRREYQEHWHSTATDHGKDGEPIGLVDFILCPVGPGAAPPLDQSKYWGYTSQWNLLDYPAVVFPVSEVDQEKDQVETDYRPRNEKDDFNYRLYTPERYRDAPVSLQLVGKRYEDEKVIAALEYIKKEIGLPFSPHR